MIRYGPHGLKIHIWLSHLHNGGNPVYFCIPWAFASPSLFLSWDAEQSLDSRVRRMQVKPTFCNEKDVIKELDDLGRGLQQGNEGSGQMGVALLLQIFHNLEGSGRVQARRYLVLQSMIH